MAIDDAAPVEEHHENVQAIHERDDAIAERDYMLKCFTELGVALTKGRPLVDGDEIRMVFPSRADAEAAAGPMHTLRGLVTVAGPVH